MKKYLGTLCVLAMLCGCSSKPSSSAAPSPVPSVSPKPTATPEPAETPPPDAEIPPAPVFPASVSPAQSYDEGSQLTEYRDRMDGPLADIAFIGQVDSEHSLEDVLTRASGWPEFGFLQETGTDRVYYGDRSTVRENVYLIIPSRGVQVMIWEREGSIETVGDIYYEAADDGPFFFVEEGDEMDAPSVICARRPNGDADLILSGTDALYGRLRTEQHMGFADVTPYDLFTNLDIPMYGQICLDSLLAVPEAAEAVNSGAQLSAFGDGLVQDDMCIIYAVVSGDAEKYYAVHWDTEDQEAEIYSSEDGSLWQRIR
ncbi:MAG: hypothetical protein IKG46_04790 [Solobacterium sp.]|nr:hypothetical protein [Solobacterium sp.]